GRCHDPAAALSRRYRSQRRGARRSRAGSISPGGSLFGSRVVSAGCSVKTSPSAEPFRWSEWSERVTRLNAPRANNTTLIEPPLELAAQMATANERILSAADYDLQGIALAQLAADAREQLLAEALRYTRTYRDVAYPEPQRFIFLAGHQPEIF